MWKLIFLLLVGLDFIGYGVANDKKLASAKKCNHGEFTIEYYFYPMMAIIMFICLTFINIGSYESMILEYVLSILGLPLLQSIIVFDLLVALFIMFGWVLRYSIWKTVYLSHLSKEN